MSAEVARVAALVAMAVGAAACGDRTALWPAELPPVSNSGAGGIHDPGGTDAGGSTGDGGRQAGVGGAAGAGAKGMGGATGAAGRGLGGSTGSGGATGLSGCLTGSLLQGTQALIDFFVTDPGIIVVRSDAVLLLARDGSISKTVPFAREITSAAYDGTTLVVADRAALTVLDGRLAMGASAFLQETCAASVLVSGNRFVCGPANDWDRIFYTYDVGAPMPLLIGMSAPYTYNGTPMRRVPGTDDFITVSTNSSPSDFHLYRVGDDGKVIYINESPYHGDFAVTNSYAFDGSPPTHVIQPAGLMLRIYGNGCASTMNSFNTGCFVKDGELGTLRTGEGFVGLGDDGAGALFAVVAVPSASTFNALCKSGCSFQRIDLTTHTITSQRSHPISDLLTLVNTIGDPLCHQIVVGYRTPSPTSSFDPGGFRIQSLDY